MYYCPKCNKKYDNQEEVCLDCDSALELDKNQVDFLFTASDINEAVLIEDILSSNDINSFRKYQSSGEYLTLYMGFSNLGIDIYVLSSDIKSASIALSNSLPKYNELANKEDTTSEDKIHQKKLIKKVLLFSLLSPIILYIFVYFMIKSF